MSIDNITEGYGKNIAMLMQEEIKKNPDYYDLEKRLKNYKASDSKDTVQISDEAAKEYSKSKVSIANSIHDTTLKTISGVCTMGFYNDFNRALSVLSDKSVDPDAICTSNYSEKKISELSEHFPSEEGTRTDTFSQYANKMAAVYKVMSDSIDEKYADSNNDTKYYFADDGTIQELTRDKEHEMLDRVYRDQCEFMAASTELWNTMDPSKYYTIYDKSQKKSNTEEDTTQTQSIIVDSNKGEIKNAAYQAFMSAAGLDNMTTLFGTEGTWNHVKLDYGISESQLSDLNKIWDYLANRKDA